MGDLTPHGRLSLLPRRLEAPAFAPHHLPGLAAWYRAGDSRNTVTSGAIETAFDLSGHGRHGASSGAGVRPADTADPGGSAVISFDGVDDVLTVTDPPELAGGVTLLAVYRIRTPVLSAGIVAAGGAAGADSVTGFVLRAGSADLNRRTLAAHAGEADPLAIGTRGALSGREYAVCTVADAGGELRDVTAVGTDTKTDLAFDPPATIAIGARLTDGAPDGPFAALDLYELALYDRVLSSAERDQLEVYVQARYGVVWEPGHLDPLFWHDDWSDLALSGGLIDQWADRSGNGRHWAAAGSARPTSLEDAAGRLVARFDGIDDVMALAGAMPSLAAGTLLLVYRSIAPVAPKGIFSPAALTGFDHRNFFTFQWSTAGAGLVQWLGRSSDADPLLLVQPDDAALAQAAVLAWDSGGATAYAASGVQADSYTTNFGTPAAIVLGSRRGSPDATNFNFANVDLLATVLVGAEVSAADAANLLAWAAARFGL